MYAVAAAVAASGGAVDTLPYRSQTALPELGFLWLASDVLSSVLFGRCLKSKCSIVVAINEELFTLEVQRSCK